MITTTAAPGYRSMMNNTDWRHELARGKSVPEGGVHVASNRVDAALVRTPYTIPGGMETPANGFCTLWRNSLPVARVSC